MFKGDSGLQRIEVSEQDGRRYLLFGPEQEQETACSLEDPDHPVFEYPCLMLPALALKADTKDLLLVGLGGGWLPGLLQRHRPDIAVTVVEVDPLVPKLAEEFFDFYEGGSVRVVVADGREYLETCAERYDQIWLDAYGGDYIPEHLTTVEFLEVCRDRLKPRGVVVQNVHVEHRLFGAHLATMTEVFGYFYQLRGERGTNAALFARKDVDRPSSVKSAFNKGLRAHGARIGSVNLKAELRKASLGAYEDGTAVLRDFGLQ